MNRHKKFTRNLFLVTLVAFAGCSASESEDVVNSVNADESYGAVESAPTQTKAQFTATLLSGETFDSATVLKTQPLALWFWAPG